MGFRTRIKELRYAHPAELTPHPKNWRVHGEEQAAAFQSLLSTLGLVDAVIAYEDEEGKLVVVNGHLRRAALESGADAVPVLVTDLTAAEAEYVLATFDAVGDMARTDERKRDQLLAELAGVFPDVDLEALHRRAVAEIESEPEGRLHLDTAAQRTGVTLVHILKVGNIQINLLDTSAEKLAAFIKDYVAKHGSTIGLGELILDKLPRFA